VKMGRGSVEIGDRKTAYDIEKIKALKQKYGTEIYEQQNSFDDAGDNEYESLVITEEIEVTDEAEIKFTDINQELSPCIDELLNIQREIEYLKQKFKSPFAYIEKEHHLNAHHTINNVVKEEEEVKEKSEVSLHFAKVANERDIQHMVCDIKGNSYTLQNFVKETDANGRERLKRKEKRKKVLIECQVKDGVNVTLKANLNEENPISFAGVDIMKLLGLTRADLQPCIDTVTIPDEPKLELVGERVLALSKGQLRTLTRVVFIQGVRGLHLSWFLTRELEE